jgi:hypothetical protein
MKYETISENKKFVGRTEQIKKLQEIGAGSEAKILVVHGRRRVGKTELIEQVFRNRRILKFEGLENLPDVAQQQEFLRRLSRYTGNQLYNQLTLSGWQQIFELLAEQTKNGEWTIFLEELQWMANYKTDLLSQLKPVWDNNFRRNPKLLLILCGSSPSFMVNKVIMSKALYGRSMHQLSLKPFSISEICNFLGSKSKIVGLDTELLVGGSPAYIQRLAQESSIYLGFCKNACSQDSYFLGEIDKIFLSTLAKNHFYRKIINFLALERFASRKEIFKKLKITSGGTNSLLLEDLELSTLINSYSTLGSKENSKLTRYEISDSYLQTYYRFLKPQLKEIIQGKFEKSAEKLLPLDRLAKMFGYGFERWCRKNAHKIAEILGFSDVPYDFGPFYNRSTQKTSTGYQLDLVFKRADKTFTICEVKYLNKRLGLDVAREFNKKLELFSAPKNFRVQKILITVNDYHKDLATYPNFDRVLRFEEIVE